MEREVKLPPRRITEVPRLILADAYTTSGNKFQSERARRKSVYYATFRRELHLINEHLYKKGDNRIVFYGLGRILERLFYDPITHKEIDNAKRFLATAKIRTDGIAPYDFPEDLWRSVVDNYNGRPPIRVEAMPEGSIVYLNEPNIQCESTAPEDEEMGELAAWFESKLLQSYGTSERATQDRHWFQWLYDTISEIDSENPQLELDASSMMTDFGDRAGLCKMESEEIPMGGLLTFMGTDTFSAAYPAWWESGQSEPTGISVWALAHRNVQAYKFEGDCYRAMYDAAEDNSILSMVSDCYDYKNAVLKYSIPLAKESMETGNGKVIVDRPDSGDALHQVLWTCREAVKAGLYTERELKGKDGKMRTFKFATTLKFIEGDGMTFPVMKEIIHALIAEGFAPHGWGLFGVGGGLRNNLKRDNLSMKYALCAVGDDLEGVIKSSEVAEKSSLPGPFVIYRDEESIRTGRTVDFRTEETASRNAMVVYFDGSNIWEPFGPGIEDHFLIAKARLNEQWTTMPKDLPQRFPGTQRVLDERDRLLEIYAPSKMRERAFNQKEAV